MVSVLLQAHSFSKVQLCFTASCPRPPLHLFARHEYNRGRLLRLRWIKELTTLAEHHLLLLKHIVLLLLLLHH